MDEISFMTNEGEVGLPPLQSSRKAVWDYYQIEFLPNGYPGKRTDDGLFTHPIYGPYVIADYTAQFRRTKDPTYLEAACHVADAAIEQMTRVGDGIAFLYGQDDTKVSSKVGDWYSGLTQARYVEVLDKLLALPGTERFREPMGSILRSLLVPVELGGVARWVDGGGLVIEEYPSAVADCTLNGWTTATVILGNYAQRNNDAEAWSVFRQSVCGLESLIHLYDVPELATSRYKLAGNARVRLRADDAGIEVRNTAVVMPGAGEFPANAVGDPAGQNLSAGPVRITGDSSRELVVMISRFTWPSPNVLSLEVEAEVAGRLKIDLAEAIYNPLASGPRFGGFTEIADLDVNPGTNSLKVPIPWAEAEMVSHPTNFGKRIANRQFNQYHWIHVDTLSKILQFVDSDKLLYFRDKWARAPKRWPEMKPYQDDRLTLERFDAGTHK